MPWLAAHFEQQDFQALVEGIINVVIIEYLEQVYADTKFYEEL